MSSEAVTSSCLMCVCSCPLRVSGEEAGGRKGADRFAGAVCDPDLVVAADLVPDHFVDDLAQEPESISWLHRVWTGDGVHEPVQLDLYGGQGRGEDRVELLEVGQGACQGWRQSVERLPSPSALLSGWTSMGGTHIREPFDEVGCLRVLLRCHSEPIDALLLRLSALEGGRRGHGRSLIPRRVLFVLAVVLEQLVEGPTMVCFLVLPRV